MPSYRSKDISVEGIHRNLLSSVRQRKYDVANFIIQATGHSTDQFLSKKILILTFLSLLESKIDFQGKNKRKLFSAALILLDKSVAAKFVSDFL